MATPFAGVITIKNMVTGEVAAQSFTMSDVAAAYATFINTNNNFINAPGKKGQQCYITDIQAAAAATVTQAQLNISGRDTGVRFLLAGVVPTINNRLPQPIPLQGGSAIQLVQR